MNNPSTDTTSARSSNGPTFALEAFADFQDDACGAPEPITPAHIDAMMRRLVECGMRRVSWEVYGDGRSGFLHCDASPEGRNYALTYHGMGQNTLQVAVQAAHAHGLKIYGYFKPYETGYLSFPEGSYEAMIYGRLSQVGGQGQSRADVGRTMSAIVARHHEPYRRRDGIGLSAPTRSRRARAKLGKPTVGDRQAGASQTVKDADTRRFAFVGGHSKVTIASSGRGMFPARGQMGNPGLV